MTETMLRTSAEKSALKHNTLHPKAINYTKNSVHCTHPKLSCSMEVNKEEVAKFIFFKKQITQMA